MWKLRTRISNMSSFLVLVFVVVFISVMQTVHCDDEALQRSRRAYCATIRISKRSPRADYVDCPSGQEFCYTSNTCCCRIPESQDNLGKNLGISLGILGVALTSSIFVICLLCARHRAHRAAMLRQGGTTVIHTRETIIGIKEASRTRSSNGRARYDSDDMSSMEYGYPSVANGGASTARYEKPFSISESVPPPPYSELSFDQGANGPTVLYNHGKKSTSKAGHEGSPKMYSRRSSYQSGSLSSRVKSPSYFQQDDGSLPRSQSRNGRRSSTGSSRHGTLVGVTNEGFNGARTLVTIPQSIASKTAGTTVAASEVFYGTGSSKMPPPSSRGKRSTPSSKYEGDVASRHGSTLTRGGVSYNPSVASRSERAVSDNSK